LTEGVCRELGVSSGKREAIRFSEGNTFVRILENVRGCEVFIVQTLSHPVNDNFIELLFWIDAFNRASAKQTTAVIPFFSYGKGDKKDEPRVSIRARVCAECIESVGADRLLTMDLHAPQIQGFFRVPVDHLYALPIFANFLEPRIKDPKEWVLVSPDAGFAKQARKYARFLGVGLAIADKDRPEHDEIPEIMEIMGDVKGKHAVIVDDFALSARSLVEVSEGLVERGVKDVFAAVSHGVFTDGAAALIDRSPIRRVITTDTVEHRFEPLSDKVEIISAAGLFADAIRSIHERTSVSRLFPSGL
jgi:ribose-phosphate pyrophosphokinase